jgi:hypothetical protein
MMERPLEPAMLDVGNHSVEQVLGTSDGHERWPTEPGVRA